MLAHDALGLDAAYPAGEFAADAEAAGVHVQHRFASYELHPPDDEYAVWVLAARD